MLDVCVTDNEIRFGGGVTVGFERTLRIPADGRPYRVPPGLDVCPLYRVEEYAKRVPASWRADGGVFLHLYPWEAMWIAFSGRWWRPNAVKVAVGTVNAVTGEPWKEGLSCIPQDYIVVPEQPWLGGIAAGQGYIRQFVAAPVNAGHAAGQQTTNDEESGKIRITVFEPRPGRFPDEPPDTAWRPKQDAQCFMACRPPTTDQTSRTAGAAVRQTVRPDEHGLDAWDPDDFGCITIHIVNTAMFRKITGTPPPPTPISRRHYVESRLPWLDSYAESPREQPSVGRP